MPAFKDITGLRYGRLVAVRLFFNMDKHGGSCWHCQCDCGTEKVIRGQALLRGLTVSCGCFHREELERSRSNAWTLAHARLYKRWVSML